MSTHRSFTPREAPEDSIPLRVAVFLAVYSAALAVLGEDIGSTVLQVAVLVGLPASFVIAYLVRRRRPLVLRVIVTALAVIAFVAVFGTLTGNDITGFAQAQVPLAEVFLWLQILHTLDSPGRRGLMLSLVSALTLMAIAAVFSLSFAIVPFLAVWAVSSIAALALAHRSRIHDLPQLGARTGVDAPASAARPGTVRLRAGITFALVIVAVLVLGFGAFMIAPAAGTDRALAFPAELPDAESVPTLGGLANPSLGAGDPARASSGRPGGGSRAAFGYVGFSRQLDTGVRGRPDDTLVMRVRAVAPDFWRGQTFDAWNGRVWTNTLDRPRVLQGGRPIRIPPTQEEELALTVPTRELVQTYFLEQPGPNVIFNAAVPTEVYFPERFLFQLPDGTLRAGVQLDEGTVYTVVSERPMISVAALEAASTDPAAVPEPVAARYTGDGDATPRVAALARRITDGITTTYAKVQALEAWISANTEYTLNIPPLPRDADAVEQFLFEDRRGFCEQIGTALVVMLRSLGVPARLVVGYTPGERNPFTGLFEVRAKDAHAWAEVYFPGLGWQGFDPTASVPLAADSGIAVAGAGALDYLTARIPAIPFEVIVGVGILAVAVSSVLAWRRWRRVRRMRPSPPTWSAARLARFEALGARHGRARAPGETTPEFARALRARIPDPRVPEVGTTLDRLMFAGRPVGPEDVAAIDAALDDIEAAWPAPAR